MLKEINELQLQIELARKIEGVFNNHYREECTCFDGLQHLFQIQISRGISYQIEKIENELGFEKRPHHRAMVIIYPKHVNLELILK